MNEKSNLPYQQGNFSLTKNFGTNPLIKIRIKVIDIAIETGRSTTYSISIFPIL